MLRIVLVKVHAEAPRHGFCKPFQPCHLETAEFYRPMMMGNTENHRKLRHIRTLVEELVPQFLIRDCPSQLDFYDPSSNKAEPLAKRCVRLVVKSQCRKVGEIPEHVLQFDAIAICNISANHHVRFTRFNCYQCDEGRQPDHVRSGALHPSKGIELTRDCWFASPADHALSRIEPRTGFGPHKW